MILNVHNPGARFQDVVFFVVSVLDILFFDMGTGCLPDSAFWGLLLPIVLWVATFAEGFLVPCSWTG